MAREPKVKEWKKKRIKSHTHSTQRALSWAFSMRINSRSTKSECLFRAKKQKFISHRFSMLAQCVRMRFSMDAFLCFDRDVRWPISHYCSAIKTISEKAPPSECDFEIEIENSFDFVLNSLEKSIFWLWFRDMRHSFSLWFTMVWFSLFVSFYCGRAMDKSGTMTRWQVPLVIWWLVHWIERSLLNLSAPRGPKTPKIRSFKLVLIDLSITIMIIFYCVYSKQTFYYYFFFFVEKLKSSILFLLAKIKKESFRYMNVPAFDYILISHCLLALLFLIFIDHEHPWAGDDRFFRCSFCILLN